jgi:hypothetical protein
VKYDVIIQRTSSKWPTPQNRVLTDTDSDEEINIDEAVPDNRGLWVSVVYPGMFDLPESRFQEEKGPVNYTPNSSFFFFFFLFFFFLSFLSSKITVWLTCLFVKQHLTCYLVIKTYLVRTRVSGIIFIRYALIQNISEPNNFEIFDSKKTTVKGPKLNSQKST